MTISDLIAPGSAVHGLRAPGKAALLGDLSRRAGAATGLDPDAILAALLKREALGSTGVGAGVALPHARLDGLARPFGLLARLRAAIPFEAVDDRPVDLVCLLLLPTEGEAGRGDRPNALARVARRLREPGVAAALRAARDAAGLHAVLHGDSA